MTDNPADLSAYTRPWRVILAGAAAFERQRWRRGLQRRTRHMTLAQLLDFLLPAETPLLEWIHRHD